MSTKPLRNIIYVNEKLVKRLGEQLEPNPRKETSREVEFAGSLKFANFSQKRSYSDSSESRRMLELLDAVCDGLRESGQLRVFRPDRNIEFLYYDHDGWYVHERIIATPVALPVGDKLKALGVNDYLLVWVSDPLDTDETPEHEWDWIGSFLFVVQEPLDIDPMIFMSGISALRFIIEGLAEGKSLSRVNGGFDQFGRDSSIHPLKKLESVGGIAGRERKIDIVYKIAYMTDEQSWTCGGKPTRVNDIFAYPLYIAE